jgi:hypothetical protein
MNDEEKRGASPIEGGDTPMRECRKCKELLPATPDYFRKCSSCKDNLTRTCIECSNKKHRDYYQHNAEALREKSRRWRAENPEKSAEQRRSWRSRNRERDNAKNRRWKHANPDKERVYAKVWQERNPTARTEAARRLRQAKPQAVRLIAARRRARQRNLPSTFTEHHWRRCLHYWKNRCAVCGREDGDQHMLVGDHWWPVKMGGGTTPDNIVPLCHSKKGGRGGCNNSKLDHSPQDFLARRLGADAAQAKLREIEAYFEWVKKQDESGD